MMGATLALYFIVLFGALLFSNAESIGIGELFAFGMLALIASTVVKGFWTLAHDEEVDEPYPKRKRLRIPKEMWVPEHVLQYLQKHEVDFKPRHHHYVVQAQRLAHDIHMSGDIVAKSVMVKADGTVWMAVLPASKRIDFASLAKALKVKKVTMMSEAEFKPLFSDCELGAEPPFGQLYGMPVVVDARLDAQERLVFRAGSHMDMIEMKYADYRALEQPVVAKFSVQHT